MIFRFFPLAVFICAAANLHAQSPGGWPARYSDHIFVHTDRSYYLAGETIWVKMYCAMQPGVDSLKSTIGYLELANPVTKTTVLHAKVDLKGNGAASLNLPDTLPTGDYLLYAYTTKSIDSGQVFKAPLVIQNTFNAASMLLPQIPPMPAQPSIEGIELALATNSPVGRRSPVELTFKLSSMPKNAAPAKFSLSVFRMDGLNAPALQTILSLGNKSAMQQLPIFFHDPIQDNAQILSGEITLAGGQPATAPAFFTIPGRKPRYFGVNVNNGKFSVEPGGFSGETLLLVTIPGKKPSVTLEDPFKNVVQYDQGLTPRSAVLDSASLGNLTEAHIAVQVNKVFYADSLFSYIDPLEDSLPLWGHYDESVILDDYTRFNTLEEVFREMVKTVNVRRSGDTLHLHTLNNTLLNPKFFETDPLVLLDGVPLFDNKQLFAIDPLKIRKVCVYARKVYMGPFQYTGLVLLQTYGGDLGGIPLDKNMAAVDISGTAVQQQFFAPDYSADLHSTLPDQRLLLYWAPNLTISTTRATQRIYTGDLPGTYCAVLQGISPAGIPCYATCYFTVK